MGEVHAVSLTGEESGPDAPAPQVNNQQTPHQIDGQSEPLGGVGVPDKFKNAETGEVDVQALLASYNHLEQKLGGGPEVVEETPTEEPDSTEEVEASEEEDAPPPEGALDKYSQEFFESGELKEESYTALESMGYPKDLVNSFIEGQKALVANEQESLYAEVGGAEAYSKMSEWAAMNMTEEAKLAYNSAVQSGDMEQARLAIRGLRDSYSQSEGVAPNLLQGKANRMPAAAPFRSTAQLVEAMSNPKYKTDPAYREDVENRLRGSQL